MTIKEKAFSLGVAAAKAAIPFDRAIRDKCPFQSVGARQAFIDGWRSILDPYPQPTNPQGEQT